MLCTQSAGEKPLGSTSNVLPVVGVGYGSVMWRNLGWNCGAAAQPFFSRTRAYFSAVMLEMYALEAAGF